MLNLSRRNLLVLSIFPGVLFDSLVPVIFTLAFCIIASLLEYVAELDALEEGPEQTKTTKGVFPMYKFDRRDVLILSIIPAVLLSSIVPVVLALLFFVISSLLVYVAELDASEYNEFQ